MARAPRMVARNIRHMLKKDEAESAGEITMPGGKNLMTRFIQLRAQPLD